MTKAKKIIFTCLFIIIVSTGKILAQDTLPNFTVRDLGNGKAQISWVNPFENVVQMIIQRSFDSTKYFRSIFSSQSPWLPQNGYVDTRVPVGYKVYYRVHYVFEGGSYFFSSSKIPQKFIPIKVVKVNNKNEKEENQNEDKDSVDNDEVTKEEKTIKVYKTTKDTLIAIVKYKDYKKYKDSVNKKTKDTLLLTENDDEVIIMPYVPKPVWKASTYIFTNDQGFVRIYLPLAKRNHYKIVFYNEQHVEVLFIKHIKEGDLILDKSNFKSTGWYYFELFENDKLKEKNKLFVSKDK
jgi:hypothetical protein